ncbi:hypothetical protein LguiB_016990 [Lonicera macranthoides]
MANERQKAVLERKVEGQISYADAVRKSKINNIFCKEERQISTDTIASYAFDWKRVVVCIRENLWDSWNGIQSSLNQLYNSNFQLKPLLPNKAIIICDSEEAAQVFGSKKLVFLSGPYAIRLQRWDEKEIYQNRKIACTGGWINIHGLPANWWTEKAFQTIGERCGGLIQVDARTKTFQNLLMARIKVRGNHNGFIPASMMIYTGSDSEYFAVSLVSTSKLICEKRNRSMNCPSGGTKSMEVPLVSEGEEEVILEYSTHVDEGMVQNKVTTVAPMKLSCDGKTQEKAEDKLDEDDLEYESSSFAEDVSSTGTIVEESQEELSRDFLYRHLEPEEQSEKAIMEVIQGHATVNAMWPVVLGNHGGTLQDHSLLSMKEITTRDYETANKSHEEEELDAVSNRGEEDGIRVDTRSKGMNMRRMSNLTKFKWVQRPSQVYSRRKMKGKVTLNADEEMEGTSNGKVMEGKGGSEAVSSSDQLESDSNDSSLKVLFRENHFSESGNSQKVVCRESTNNKDWVGLNEVEKLKYTSRIFEDKEATEDELWSRVKASASLWAFSSNAFGAYSIRDISRDWAAVLG